LRPVADPHDGTGQIDDQRAQARERLGTRACNNPKSICESEMFDRFFRTKMPTLLAAACGLIAANVYYAQPLVAPISATIGLPLETAGLIVTMTQLGYGAGLLLIVPLGDLLENRCLIQVLLAVDALALIGAATSANPLPFLLSALFIGGGSVAVQVIVPYATHLLTDDARGRTIGHVMSGLILGIVLARPAASFIAAVTSWRLVFALSALSMATLAWVLGRALPPRHPAAGLRYLELLRSLGRLALTTPALRRRALYQAGLFASFSLFWTAVPLRLAEPPYYLSQGGIAIFALAGAAGAAVAPIAGALADRGWTRIATGVAMTTVAAALLIAHQAPSNPTVGIGALVLAAVLLDVGLSVNLILGQRTLFALGAEVRSRLNGLYVAAFFLSGALGSTLATSTYARGGWLLASEVGFTLPLAAIVYYATEFL